ncbi:hypothetical protein TanjilG_05973 [Lupinus angustifolius]|uniref:LOB domain-containing protein n=1 Tax=Lupinus angustifolius TaxID=3871 RepID=A0A4P1REG5_LUPAN|nr:PREDICTED: LOB domain-containing protein 22-like [Lupinus angustifolius]OIW08997.1 hypothetical protein TanjilG_05973 [Lupinus angustifolius]
MKSHYNNTKKSQACAACKYQRRKCPSNCIFAPYFPHDRQKQFLNAHKLFGVGKINNLIKPLDAVQRDIAMSTIIYESNMRANDPVGGCVGCIHRICSQIARYEAELRIVLQHLVFFRAQYQPITESVQYDPYIADNIINVNDDVIPFHESDIHFQEQLKLLSRENAIKDGIAVENVNACDVQNSNSGLYLEIL